MFALNTGRLTKEKLKYGNFELLPRGRLSPWEEMPPGKEPAFEMCPGLLETRFYAAYDIPAYAYGPGLLTVSHGPNEFVPILNIAQCAALEFLFQGPLRFGILS